MIVRSAEVFADKLACTSPAKSDDETLGDVVEWLHDLACAFYEQSREINKVSGISRNELQIIKTISRSSSINVSELAKRMQMSSVTTVRTLDSLEKQGLITRNRSSKDRRVVELSITDKAKEIDSILGRITHEIMKCCLGASDDNDLMERLKPLQNLSSSINSISHDISKTRIVDSEKANV